MAVLSVETATVSGLEATDNAANAGGDSFANDGNTFLNVKNGSGGDITVTVNSQVTNPCPGQAAADIAVVITAGEERIIGPFNQQAFNNANGQVELTYSGVTSLTVAVIKGAFAG
jgi:hypothetical protein